MILNLKGYIGNPFLQILAHILSLYAPSYGQVGMRQQHLFQEHIGTAMFMLNNLISLLTEIVGGNIGLLIGISSFTRRASAGKEKQD